MGIQISSRNTLPAPAAADEEKTAVTGRNCIAAAEAFNQSRLTRKAANALHTDILWQAAAHAAMAAIAIMDGLVAVLFSLYLVAR